MERGELWFVDLDPTEGREQRGRRPVFIVTPAAFNRLGTPLAAPVTTGGAFARHRGFAVSLPPGLKVQGVILCNQLRTLDLAARDGRFVDHAPEDVIEDVLARIATLVS